MAKKKSSASLFEVISKKKERRARDEIRLPDWAGRHAESASGAETVPVGVPGPPPVASPAGPAAGRLTLSLNYASWAAAAAGLVLLLCGAFWLGRRTAPAGPVHAAGVGDLTDREGAARVKEPAGTTRPKPPERIAGKHYLVIQQLPGKSAQDLKDARAIARWCKANGVPAEVWQSQTPSYYYVWAYRAFDSYQDTLKADAIQYAKDIEKLGLEYSKYAAKTRGELKRYDFRQRKGRKLEPHFRLYQGRR